MSAFRPSKGPGFPLVVINLTKERDGFFHFRDSSGKRRRKRKRSRRNGDARVIVRVGIV